MNHFVNCDYVEYFPDEISKILDMDGQEREGEWPIVGVVCRVFHMDAESGIEYETPCIYGGYTDDNEKMAFLCLESDEPVVCIHRYNPETRKMEEVKPDEDGVYVDIKKGDILRIEYNNGEPVQIVPKEGAFEYGFGIPDDYYDGLNPMLLSSGKTPRYDSEYSHDKNGMYVAVPKEDFQKLIDFDLFLLDEDGKFEDDEEDDLQSVDDEEDDEVYIEELDEECQGDGDDDEDEYDVEDLLLFSYEDFMKLRTVVPDNIPTTAKDLCKEGVLNAKLDDE